MSWQYYSVYTDTTVVPGPLCVLSISHVTSHVVCARGNCLLELRVGTGGPHRVICSIAFRYYILRMSVACKLNLPSKCYVCKYYVCFLAFLTFIGP